VAPWLGTLVYRSPRQPPLALATLQAYVRNEGNAWQFTLDEISAFFERVLALSDRFAESPRLEGASRADTTELPPPIVEAFGGYLEAVQLIAQRLAELHELTSSAAAAGPAYDPEPMNAADRRDLYQSMRSLISRVLFHIRHLPASLTTDCRPAMERIHQGESDLYRRIRPLVDRPISAWQFRTHGNCQLAKLLRTGNDFIFLIDSPDWRRGSADPEQKHPGCRDVARMVYSFHLAAAGALDGFSTRHGSAVGLVRPEDYASLSGWADLWRGLVTSTFEIAYRARVASTPRLAIAEEAWRLLLDTYLLEYALGAAHEQMLDHSPKLPTTLKILARLM
jgi:maltose alpha-D-glucosyltransferase/alpha-amylase